MSEFRGKVLKDFVVFRNDGDMNVATTDNASNTQDKKITIYCDLLQ